MKTLQRSIGAMLAACAVLSTAVAMQTAPPTGQKASPPATTEKPVDALKIGAPAPVFVLEDHNGKVHRLSDFKGKTVVLEWFNPGCPYCVGVYQRGVVRQTVDAMKKMGENYVYIAINSSADRSRSDVISMSKEFLAAQRVDIPVLIDHDGKVGKAYHAKTTPHMFIIDGEGVLRYQGAFTDDPNFRKGAEATNYVLGALTKMAAGETVSPDQVKPWGCSVKYAPAPKTDRPPAKSTDADG